jgi:hypothetical protein
MVVLADGRFVLSFHPFFYYYLCLIYVLVCVRFVLICVKLINDFVFVHFPIFVYVCVFCAFILFLFFNTGEYVIVFEFITIF